MPNPGYGRLGKHVYGLLPRTWCWNRTRCWSGVLEASGWEVVADWRVCLGYQPQGLWRMQPETLIHLNMATTLAQSRELRSTIGKKGAQDLTAKEVAEILPELKEVIASTLVAKNIPNNTTVTKATKTAKSILVFVIKLNFTNGAEEIKAAKALKESIDETFNRDHLLCKTEIHPPLPKGPVKKK